jgi:hypothetical protein
MTPTEWLLSGDTGSSSETICMVMTESSAPKGRYGNPPSDNSDFGRCYRLLKHFPEWRSRLKEVAKRFPAWRPYVDAWNELTALYESYCDPLGHVTDALYKANKATAKKMYERMKAVEREGRIADGWVEDAPGSWSKGEGFIITIGGMELKA